MIVFRRAGNEIHIEEGRDVWWHRELEYVDAQMPARARSIASIRFTFSTPAARPENRRGFCTRPAAIWSAFTPATKYVFDLRDDDIYWCTADIGWVTGHSYVVYGPLAAWRDHLDV